MTARGSSAVASLLFTVKVAADRSPRRTAVIASCGLLLLVVSGCSTTAGATGHPSTSGSGSRAARASGSGTDGAGSNGSGSTAGGAIPLGPGPTSPYIFQTQPPAGSCHYRYKDGYPLPDPICTPGALNPKVTQATLKSTICRSGYTSSIRPPSSITGREKIANARSYGYTGSTKTGEYDHLISLELGGDPNDPRNLWVEPNDKRQATGTNNSKDTVENSAHSAICAGKITLAAVQSGIAGDWVTFGRALGLDLPAIT